MEKSITRLSIMDDWHYQFFRSEKELMTLANGSTQSPFATLRQFARPKPKGECCELCRAPLHSEHQHLIEVNARRLVCSCDACSILFSGQQNGKYRRVPRRIERLVDFRITDSQWENLHLPINLAFFYFSTPAKKVVAMFPSPAGATESLLTLEAWDDLVRENPVLLEFEPDVEALMVSRVAESREYCRVPIDECFKLVGLIRTHWRGLSGGMEVWAQIARYFHELKEKSVNTGATNV
jgi:hypothetical protein